MDQPRHRKATPEEVLEHFEDGMGAAISKLSIPCRFDQSIHDLVTDLAELVKDARVMLGQDRYQ